MLLATGTQNLCSVPKKLATNGTMLDAQRIVNMLAFSFVRKKLEALLRIISLLVLRLPGFFDAIKLFQHPK